MLKGKLSFHSNLLCRQTESAKGNTAQALQLRSRNSNPYSGADERNGANGDNAQFALSGDSNEEYYIQVLRNYPRQDSTKYTNFPMQSNGSMRLSDRKIITVKIDEEI